MTLATQRSPAVFLFGPTAVGKTDLLSQISPDRYEVVSADSLQVYRGLDIGTAKPTTEFRTRLQHHLVDIIDPADQFDVGEFVRLAEIAITGIHSRGRTALVSGGAGFYLRRLLYGMPRVPASAPEVRKKIQSDLQEHGLPHLYERLARVDPPTAARVGPNDGYRITRALEVYESSGRPLSEFPLPASPRQDMNVKLIGLERPRAELHQRIAARVEQMFAAGLRDEVERLVGQGYRPDHPGLRGIGYQEFFSQSGTLRPRGEDDAIGAKIQRNTRRYAKRQITFFRGLAGVEWMSAADVSRVIDALHAFSHDASRPLLDS